jgi:hypothetical protein
MKGQLGFFDLADRYAQLRKSGDPLGHLSARVDFEPFRYRLVKALKRSDGSKGGRPPYNPVLMFKILILQAFVRSVRRTGGVPDPRPAVLHALSWSGSERSGSRRDDDLAFSRTADPHRCGEGPVCTVRCAAARKRATSPCQGKFSTPA